MARNQDAVLLFMGSAGCSCFPTALGLLDLLEEMDRSGTLREAADVYFWAKLQWRSEGISRETITAAYLDYKQNDIRGKAREKKRKQRMSLKMSPEKGDNLGDTLGDTLGDNLGDKTGDSFPSPSSPAPFLPPSPPTPPVTPYNPPNPITPTSSCSAREGEHAAARPDIDTVEAYAAAQLNYLSPRNMQELTGYIDDLGEDLIRHAIDEACANGKRSYAYVRSILNRYHQSGYKTLGDARAGEDRHRQMQQQKPAAKYSNPALDYAQRSNDDVDYSSRVIDLTKYYEGDD